MHNYWAHVILVIAIPLEMLLVSGLCVLLTYGHAQGRLLDQQEDEQKRRQEWEKRQSVD